MKYNTEEEKMILGLEIEQMIRASSKNNCSEV
jgi:hypothetical protein